MPDDGISVEGPDFVELVARAEDIVRTLERNDWDFNTAPEAFARRTAADVFAKEILIVFDGKRLTRLGRLVMAGTGDLFNLMGPIHPQSTFKTGDDRLLAAIHEQTGTRGLDEFPEFCEVGKPQRVEFFNHTNFFQLRDLVFWSVLHGSGCSPSTLEHMARHFASGMVIQNVMYRPQIPSRVAGQVAYMAAACLSVSFPASEVEWMDKPLFGGLFKETIHTEYLLTPEKTDLAHPYLPFVDEGVVEYQDRAYHLRMFAGITPKNGVRGDGIGPEQKTSAGTDTGWIKSSD